MHEPSAEERERGAQEREAPERAHKAGPGSRGREDSEAAKASNLAGRHCAAMDRKPGKEDNGSELAISYEPAREDARRARNLSAKSSDRVEGEKNTRQWRAERMSVEGGKRKKWTSRPRSLRESGSDVSLTNLALISRNLAIISRDPSITSRHLRAIWAAPRPTRSSI
eukprot:5204013-Pleurochrysis_carterae.AAC.1